MKHVFIIGSKGIPASYGGFETFVDVLTEKSSNDQIKYYVSCLSRENNTEFLYNNSICFNVKTPHLGSSEAILYDLLSLNRCFKYIKENKLKNCIIYILACRIGPFLTLFKRQLSKLNISLMINPDGHEWKRSKWGPLVKKYWKASERLMVKNSDLVICDSKGIENYILKEYDSYNLNTTYIAYGASIAPSKISSQNERLVSWFINNGVKPKEYYLIVGRFVPENNYETMISEYMKSNSNKDLVIVSNFEKNNFFKYLIEKTNFYRDNRIKFVGTVYDEQLLRKIRESAYGYIHGHEVGGTNPSLLEALASTKVNLLLNVNFNIEVGGMELYTLQKKETHYQN